MNRRSDSYTYLGRTPWYDDVGGEGGQNTYATNLGYQQRSVLTGLSLLPKQNFVDGQTDTRNRHTDREDTHSSFLKQMGKQSILLIEPAEVELGLKVGVKFDKNDSRSC